MKKLLSFSLSILLIVMSASCSWFGINEEEESSRTTFDDTLGTIMPTGSHPGSLVFSYLQYDGKIYSTSPLTPSATLEDYHLDTILSEEEGSVEYLQGLIEEQGINHVGTVELESPEVPETELATNGFFTGDEVFYDEDNDIILIISESIVSWYNDWPEDKKVYQVYFLSEWSNSEDYAIYAR